MTGHMEICAKAAEQHIHSLLEEEKEPFTMNEHYFMDYRSKFLTHYKDARLSAKSQFIRNLENRDDGDMVAAAGDAVLSLAKIGLEGANASSFANLLPADPKYPAIEIMADVRAYFQGSSSTILLLVRLCRA